VLTIILAVSMFTGCGSKNAVVGILAVLWAFSLYSIRRYLYDFFKEKQVNIDRFKSGLIGIIVLFSVSFIGMIIINGSISNQTYGMYSNALSLTGGTYFLGITAILTWIFFIKKLEKDISTKNVHTAKGK